MYKLIEEKAISITKSVLHWQFQPIGNIIINNHDNNSHYTFTGFGGVDDAELNMVLVEYVVANFWPILYPEAFKSNTENTWKIYPL